MYRINIETVQLFWATIAKQENKENKFTFKSRKMGLILFISLNVTVQLFRPIYFLNEI